ncbi:MAG: hypothetical protein LBI28_00490 [Treponema sp.]|jgi:hypothetical protein|nr:hypothetical protein [Treponema sp.]
MHPISLWDLLKQILSSWQVIAITIAIAIYISIVSYVARSYHRPRMKKVKSFKKKKAEPTAATPEVSEEDSAMDSNDELGLEEA